MKWKSLVLVAAVVAMATTTVTLVLTRPDTRSVAPRKFAELQPAAAFSRAESTGLFVGVRDFPHDSTLSVPYAVDDAVDLAYMFSMNQRVALIPPRRVVLALSGDPQKEKSRENLEKLKSAGATIAKATAGDILNLLNDQAARAGTSGLLVVSIATHGFLRDGDSYILGSTSVFGSAETSLRLATLFDHAAQARRSLFFVDACRDRVGQTSRGATPDAATRAPLINRMRRVEGQVIFYAAAAGKYAYDDHVHRNGVFTKAVLDGLDCEASAPRGIVIADTLRMYVEREVRHWAQKNRKPSAVPATQVSMEGLTRNMPLSECWRCPGPPIRIEIDGSTIRAYDSETRPLWRRHFGDAVLQASSADLDADGLQEIVLSLRDQIIVLDRDGRPLWSRGERGMVVRRFAVADLLRKHTNQIVTIWNDERGSVSRLMILDSKGHEKKRAFDHGGELRQVLVDRPTNMHDPRIIVVGKGGVFLFKANSLTPLWRKALVSSSDAIEDLRVLDFDNDSRRDISVATKNGMTYFDFDGEIVGRKGRAEWKDVSERKRRRRD